MTRPEPKGEKGEQYVPPTEEEWLQDAIHKIEKIRKAVWGKVLPDGSSKDGADLDDHTKRAAIKLLADKLLSPYHYYCENDRREWSLKYMEASRRLQEKGEQGKGKEAPGPEKESSIPPKDPTTGTPTKTAGLSQQPTTPPDSTESPGASSKQTSLEGKTVADPVFANWPRFRVGIGGVPVAICPKCEGSMEDNRPDPTYPKSRTIPNPNTGNRRPDFKCIDPSCEWGIWLLTKEENKDKRGSAARAKKEADKIAGGKK